MILAFANDRTGFDTRVGLGYVLVHPIAVIAKIVIVQVLAASPDGSVQPSESRQVEP